MTLVKIMMMRDSASYATDNGLIHGVRDVWKFVLGGCSRELQELNLGGSGRIMDSFNPNFKV
jgi:hypothetical protein